MTNKKKEGISMKSIINFLLRVLVLWVGMTYFNNYVQIDSNQTLIIAALLMSAIQIIYALIILVSALTSTILIGCLPLIISVILLPFLSLIELWILNRYLPGFSIHGTLTYILLAISFAIFSIGSSSKESDKK